MGALAAAIVLGRRRFFGPAIEIPHSIPLAVVGSSLLWLGWFGFNAGSALASGSLAGNTVIVTHMASSVSAVITSYSIHYTKLYEWAGSNSKTVW